MEDKEISCTRILVVVVVVDVYESKGSSSTSFPVFVGVLLRLLLLHFIRPSHKAQPPNLFSSWQCCFRNVRVIVLVLVPLLSRKCFKLRRNGTELRLGMRTTTWSRESGDGRTFLGVFVLISFLIFPPLTRVLRQVRPFIPQCCLRIEDEPTTSLYANTEHWLWH